MQTMIDEN